MQGLIDSGKYKIIEVLSRDADHEVCLCIDVMNDSGYRPCLINTYRSREAIKELLPLFYDKRFQQCSGFQRLMVQDGSISVVFDYHEGEPAEEYFAGNPQLSFEERIKLADSLLLGSLELELLDDGLAGRLVSHSNVVVNKGLMKMEINYVIPVKADYSGNFRCVWLGGLMSGIFPQSSRLPLEIDEYIIRLLHGSYESCAGAYSAWREVSVSAAQTAKLYEKESTLHRYIRWLKEKKLRKRSQGSAEQIRFSR